MFGKKDNSSSSKPIVKNSDSGITYLAQECEIKGTLKSKGNARIDGRFEGKIEIAGDLVIGQSAVLTADVEAQTISIAGEVQGNIKAKELLELSSTSKLLGDINAKLLKIDQGARFIGSSTCEDSVVLKPDVTQSPEKSKDSKDNNNNNENNINDKDNKDSK